jgi:hypothetical protein
MAQIIKHRRGSIDSVKNSTSRKGELIMATGSIGSLSGPFVFIGTDEGSGLYSPASKLYAGSTAPNLVASTYGTTLDGTPFYASDDKSLYILNNSNTGNSKIDLTGNIEGNTISGVTINNLESTNVTASFFTGSFVGDASGLTNIPASGVTGLNLSKIYSGSVQVTTDAVTGEIHLDATAGIYATGSDVRIGGGNDSYMTLSASGYAAVYSYQGGTDVTADGGGNLWLWAEGGGNTNVASYDGGVVNLNTDGTTGNVNVLNGGGNVLSIYGDTNITGTLHFGDNTVAQIYIDGALFIQDNDNGVTIQSNNYAELQSTNAWVWVEGSSAYVEGTNYTRVYTDSGNVDISSYDGGLLNLNTDGGEGDVNVLNGSNKININGNSNFTGSVNVSGNTSLTGSLVVSNGSATFDQGLVAQNSNMLLTSGSSLIVQNGGNVTVDYIQGNTQSWNYLALNGGVMGAPDVELSSTGDISLWAEGGTVNVTGSLRVTGDIIFSGSINLGDYTGDTINFNGEVSSSILPQTGSSFDLGSSGQTWNNIWAENAHFTNISLNTISFSGLTEGRVLLAGPSGSVVDSGSFTYGYDGDYGDYVLTAPIIRAANDGNGTNFLIGNDMWLGDVNEANTTRFMGNMDNSVAKIYLNAESTNNYINADYNNVTLSANNRLYLESQNSSVQLESRDGQIRLNQDSGNDIRVYGSTYMYNNLYVDMIWDESNSNNYLQLHGSNTNDGYWWESGNGSDTTLLNNENNNNLNILQTNSGDVNIDATGGSVNLHSANGFNVTGSMVVSDASGVFNSSLIAYNSDLTLDGGSNINMNDGAHLYFQNGCGDIYYNSGADELTLYNDCGDIRFRNTTRTNYNMYFEDGNALHTNYINGYNGGNLDISADGSLYLYSDSNRLIQLSVNNDEDGTNYLKVQQSGVSFQTYDYTSDKIHKVNLDNLGNLGFENVQIQITGSMEVSGSFDTYGPTHIHNDLYVSGNLSILGSGSVVHISASQVDIGTNIINLNTYAPFERFAGLAVYDSGSNAGVTGSLLWDSTNNVWVYSNPDQSGNVASARLISGPLNTGSIGDEGVLTNGHFPIATGDDHISDSLLTYIGTTLALNSNKFTVDSDSGDTLIHGNFTIEGVGAEDKGDYGSYIVFRNEDNVLGFVDTIDTENVTDRLLGYNASSGVLEFSSLIDGGTY